MSMKRKFVLGVIGGIAFSFVALPALAQLPLDYCAHPNKQIIKVRSGLDIGTGRIGVPAAGCDPSTSSLTIGYDNASGGAFTFTTLPAGALQPRGQCWSYKDRNAKTTGGLAKVRVCPTKRDPNILCFNFKGFGDIGPILTPDVMPITFNACGADYEGPIAPPITRIAVWDTSPNKWILPPYRWAD